MKYIYLLFLVLLETWLLFKNFDIEILFQNLEMFLYQNFEVINYVNNYYR